MIFILCLLIFILMAALVAACFFLYKFAIIILTFENNMAEMMDSHFLTEKKIEEIIEKPLFADSPEVKKELDEFMDILRVHQLILSKAGEKLVENSKNKYVYLKE